MPRRRPQHSPFPPSILGDGLTAPTRARLIVQGHLRVPAPPQFIKALGLLGSVPPLKEPPQ
jgi:hypothetical protein